MGMLMRDDRQMQALTGLSQDQCAFLRLVCGDIDQSAPQHTYADGVNAGTRRRTPGGGSQGKLPTMANTLRFVLFDYKTSPTCDVVGTPLHMMRSKAHENLQKLSPMLSETLVQCALMPYCAFRTPEAWKAALQGTEQSLSDATERASRRAHDDATQREYSSGKKQGTW